MLTVSLILQYCLGPFMLQYDLAVLFRTIYADRLIDIAVLFRAIYADCLIDVAILFRGIYLDLRPGVLGVIVLYLLCLYS